MPGDGHNDNDEAPRGAESAPDPHGEAALLLVESLLHSLTERSIITLAEAVEIVEDAAEVAQESDALSRGDRIRRTSGTLLEAIGNSLRLDLNS